MEPGVRSFSEPVVGTDRRGRADRHVPGLRFQLRNECAGGALLAPTCRCGHGDISRSCWPIFHGVAKLRVSRITASDSAPSVVSPADQQNGALERDGGGYVLGHPPKMRVVSEGVAHDASRESRANARRPEGVTAASFLAATSRTAISSSLESDILQTLQSLDNRGGRCAAPRCRNDSSGMRAGRLTKRCPW